MESVEERYKNNGSLINSLEAADWIELLKEIAILYLPFIKNEEIEAIRNIQNIHLEYSEIGLTKISMYTNMANWKDIKIELNLSSITISKQNNHSKFGYQYELPIVVIRKILKSKLCN